MHTDYLHWNKSCLNLSNPKINIFFNKVLIKHARFLSVPEYVPDFVIQGDSGASCSYDSSLHGYNEYNLTNKLFVLHSPFITGVKQVNNFHWPTELILPAHALRYLSFTDRYIRPCCYVSCPFIMHMWTRVIWQYHNTRMPHTQQ